MFTASSIEKNKYALCGAALAPALMLGAALHGVPAQAQIAERAALEQHRQEERVEAIRQREERAASVRGERADDLPPERIPEGESPCFTFERWDFQGALAQFPWLQDAAQVGGSDPVLGRCLGGKGLALVLRRMQNRLVQEGYITSRVSLADQDLKTGTLQITVTPGLVGQIALAPTAAPAARLRLGSTIPLRSGGLLNLRDIEQGLENLRSLPSADANIQIAPTQTVGESDILIDYRQGAPLRWTVSADDAASKATGKYQGGLTLAYDNPTGLSDLAYLSLNRDLDLRSADGARSGVLHYSVPFGYWSAAITYDRSRHYQKISGLTQDYTYSGKSDNLSLRLGRILWRDAHSKTTVAGGAFQKKSSNYIDDTEVEVQRRRTAGWFAQVQHQHYTDAGGVLAATLDYRRGTGAFGAAPAAEELFGEGTSRFQVWSASASYHHPITFAQRRWAYRLNAKAQHNGTRLTPPERFMLGGRYTVRGFDGESVLAAERGVLLRNELATNVAQGVEAYLGVDYGRVGGPTARLLVGRQLAGSVIGVRGSYKALQYDVFVGTPLYKPHGFPTARATAGFNINYSF